MPPESPHVIAGIVVALMQYVKRYLPPSSWTGLATNAIAFALCLVIAFGYAIVKGVDPVANALTVIYTAIQAFMEAIGAYEVGKNVLSKGARLL